MSKRPAKMRALAPSKAKRVAGEIATGAPVKLSLRVSQEFRAEMKVLAARQGVDMQELVLEAVAAQYPDLPPWRLDE